MENRIVNWLFLCLAGLLISCSGNVNNGRHDVVNETYVHRYGVEVPPDEWQESGRDGHIVSTLANGVVVNKCFEKGVLEGETSYTYPNSRVTQRVETFHHNQLTKEMEFTHSGLPAKEICYLPDGCKSMTVWYEDGSPQSVEQLDSKGLILSAEYYDQHQTKEAEVIDGNGMRLIRNAAGELQRKDTINQGGVALSSAFYPNGAIKEITPYLNGAMHGVRKTYFQSGEPNHIEEWKEGKKDGITTVYQNGAKSAEIPYVSGLKHGVEKHFSDDQTVVEEIAWVAGLRHGPAMSFLGQTTRTEWYYQGRPVTQSNYEFMTGHS